MPAALRYGLVNQVVAEDALDATIDAWARRIASQPAWAVHMTKAQFQAYAEAVTLGDVAALDGELLTGGEPRGSRPLWSATEARAPLSASLRRRRTGSARI